MKPYCVPCKQEDLLIGLSLWAFMSHLWIECPHDDFISERCKNVFSLFLHCALVASLMEYVISLTLENLFGMRWWNYSDKFLNIDGRICLGASVLFGVCGTIIVKFLHPLLYRFINKNITEEMARKLVKVVLVLFVCDVLIYTQSYLFLGKISIE